jgi:glutamine synthetase
MPPQDTTASFVTRHGLWSEEQHEQHRRAVSAIAESDLQTIRFAFPDQHGVLRGKTLTAREAARAFENGCSITSTLFAKDTSHRSVFPVFAAGGGFGMSEMQGGSDVLMVPDPMTFRAIP